MTFGGVWYLGARVSVSVYVRVCICFTVPVNAYPKNMKEKWGDRKLKNSFRDRIHIHFSGLFKTGNVHWRFYVNCNQRKFASNPSHFITKKYTQQHMHTCVRVDTIFFCALYWFGFVRAFHNCFFERKLSFVWAN